MHRPRCARLLALSILVAIGCLATGDQPAFAQTTNPAPLVDADQTAASDSSRDEEGFQPLFDGQTLTGWEGDPNWFRIEQQAIVAGTLTKPIPHNVFLCTLKSYANFELRLQVKVLGEDVNAGIQFRTARIPQHHEVSGYQADVGGVGERSVWGGLYDESRRNRMLVSPLKDLSSIKLDGWNDYRIRCQGNHIELWINDVKTCDYLEQDASIATTGVIALQIHAGPASEAWYRNIRLKSL